MATATYAWSATVTVCGTGCSTTSLQAALNSLANCGDTIQIKSTETQTGNFSITYRGCGANPITVTSDRAAWLPTAGARITPSHLANMAQIVTNNSAPALADALDGMGRPPAGWVFVGIAFSTIASTYNVVAFNSNGTAANASQIPDNITFDRCYFFQPSKYAGEGLQNVMRSDATNLTVKNSFFGDGFLSGVESHGMSTLTSAGPITVTNNFVTTSSIPVFVGGFTPSYKTYLPNGMTTNYNYFWRPWKWNSDPAQPYAADYAAAVSGAHRSGPYTITKVSNSGVVTVSAAEGFYTGSVLTIASVGGCTVANAAGWRITALTSTTFQLLNFPGCNAAYTSGGTVNEYALVVCTKNLGEVKWGVGVNWQYNVAENSWYATQCQSQFNGFTDTLRTEVDANALNPNIGKFAMSDTTHVTWTGTYRIGQTATGADSSNTQDLGICLSLPTTGTECHAIASFSGASLVSATPFSAASGGALDGEIVYAASAQLKNLTISHNVWKNVDLAASALGVLASNGIGDNGFGKNHTISQNLWLANVGYIGPKARGFLLGAAEFDFAFGPSGFTFDHNTLYYSNGMAGGSFVYLSSDQKPIQPKFDTTAITNNLFGASSSGGNGPFSGDGTADTIGTANTYFTNSNIKNNAIPGGSQSGSPSGGNTVSGNIYTAWSDPFAGLASNKGIFKLAPGGTYSRLGTDLRDLGVDFDGLPQISSLKVTAGVTAALLEFDLTAPIGDAGGTQPCTLEISSNRNLHSDLGSYTVVNDLNPVFFRQPDTSARSNAALPEVVVTGRHVYWPVGQNAAVTGDDGTSHNLALAAGTTFYGRLMCYGDSQWFTFQTGSGLSNSAQYPLAATLQIGTTAGTTGVRLQYGATSTLGSTANFTLNGNGVAYVALPLVNGGPTYYKLQFLNGTTVTYTSLTAVYQGGA